MANAITLSRLPVLVGVVLMLLLGGPWVHVAATPVMLALILLDTLDGIVARRRQEVGLVGSKLDIAVDRVVELVMWVVLAHLRMISVAIPIIFIIRGTMVDAVRSFSILWGKTSFGMMRTKWGQWLVASSAMRTGYGVAKGFAFCVLILALGLRGLLTGTRWELWARGFWISGVVISWIATAICIVRGVPVVLEARTVLRDLEPTGRPPEGA